MFIEIVGLYILCIILTIICVIIAFKDTKDITKQDDETIKNEFLKRYYKEKYKK